MKTALWMAVALAVAPSVALAQTKTPARTSAPAPAAATRAPLTVSSLLPAPAALATPSNPAQEHERQLQAIRQAMLEATMDRPTRVISSAWVDGDGVLHGPQPRAVPIW